jgi:multiple sugar transport system ATP-binding protein
VAGFLGEPPMNFFKGLVKGEDILLEGNLTVPAVKAFKKIKGLNGKKIILGFRPEAACLTDNNQKHDDGFVFSAQAELKEMLGDICNLYISINNQKAIIKIPQSVHFEQGQNVSFKIAYKDMYLFDADTEEGIYNLND